MDILFCFTSTELDYGTKVGWKIQPFPKEIIFIDHFKMQTICIQTIL